MSHSYLDKYTVTTEYTIKNTIEHMQRELIKAVVVVDSQMHVLGLFSNGDMRNYYLKGGALSDPITVAMNSKPVLFRTVKEVDEERKIRERVIYPVVDEQNVLIRIIDDDKRNENEIISHDLDNIPLVIMAGGKGTRLYPYTKILPKPLIPIGENTITEHIINSFMQYGCRRVIMILNHKASMIKAYLSELEMDCDIEFVIEDEFLGTAGGLGLLRDKLDSTFILSNCDILINDDLGCVYKTHKNKGNMITFICSMKDMTIPYGVVETNSDGEIENMREKPEMSFLVNTGVYMIEPGVLDYIKDGEFIHMPDLAQNVKDRGQKIGAFPISEKSWLDMGQISEMKNMMQSLGV